MKTLDTQDRAWMRAAPLKVKKFQKPQDLLTAAVEYFNWAEDNPMVETVALKAKEPGDALEPVSVRRRTRIKTLKGFCIFTGMGTGTFDRYLGGEHGPEFQAAAEWIDNVVQQDVLEHGAADMLNPAIVQKVLGLREGVDIRSHVTQENVDNRTQAEIAKELEGEIEKIVSDIKGEPFKFERQTDRSADSPAEGKHNT